MIIRDLSVLSNGQYDKRSGYVPCAKIMRNITRNMYHPCLHIMLQEHFGNLWMFSGPSCNVMCQQGSIPSRQRSFSSSLQGLV